MRATATFTLGRCIKYENHLSWKQYMPKEPLKKKKGRSKYAVWVIHFNVYTGKKNQKKRWLIMHSWSECEAPHCLTTVYLLSITFHLFPPGRDLLHADTYY